MKKFDNKKEYTKIAEKLIEVLKSEEINTSEWVKGFKGFYNPTTNKEYTGKNIVILMLSQMLNSYEDNRFLTFNQIKKLDLTLKKGSKGTCLNYLNTYRTDLKRNLTREELLDRELIKELEDKKLLKTYKKYFTVFNGDDIEGLEKQKSVTININIDLDLNQIAKNVGVNFENKTINTAHYNIDKDCIYLPNLYQIETSFEDYALTFFHELTHATGSENRLNRKLGQYGLDEELHSTEELIAEMGSIILARYFNVEVNEDLYKNFLIYIKGWLNNIEKDRKLEVLSGAIEKSVQATTYIINKNKEVSLEKVA